MMKKLIYIFRLFTLSIILVFLFRCDSYSQDNRVWLNPGIKLGYQFGSGFIFGIEISQVWEETRTNNRYGFLVDLDFCSKAGFIRLNVAAECHPGLIGGSIGPSVIFQNSRSYFGFTTVIYSPLIISVPYINTTMSFGKPVSFELGSYLKVPVLMAGRPPSVG